jgi:hypothetical protein
MLLAFKINNLHSRIKIFDHSPCVVPKAWYRSLMIIRSQIRCPACQGPLLPAELHCAHCDLAVRGAFATNEFASLADDDLHFLRIFVLCEGRIRDMESALGVSYPSIKGRLAKLKEALAAASPSPAPPPAPAPLHLASEPPTLTPAPPSPAATADSVAVLKDLEAGRISFDQAMARLKQLKDEGP